MKKDKLKYQSSYSINVKVSGEYETIDIVQEENVLDRNAIKVSFFEERWRTPEDAIELLDKVKIVIQRYFIDKSPNQNTK